MYDYRTVGIPDSCYLLKQKRSFMMIKLVLKLLFFFCCLAELHASRQRLIANVFLFGWFFLVFLLYCTEILQNRTAFIFLRTCRSHDRAHFFVPVCPLPALLPDKAAVLFKCSSELLQKLSGVYVLV